MRTTASLQSTRAPSRAARRCTTWTTTTGALAHVFGKGIFILDFYKFFIFFYFQSHFVDRPGWKRASRSWCAATRRRCCRRRGCRPTLQCTAAATSTTAPSPAGRRRAAAAAAAVRAARAACDAPCRARFAAGAMDLLASLAVLVRLFCGVRDGFHGRSRISGSAEGLLG